MVLKRIAIVAGLSLGLCGAAMVARAADEEISIGKIMKKAFKGDNSLEKKVAQNKASADERKKFVEYVEALSKQKPEKGSAESWKDKTGALLKAAQAAANNDPGAGALVEKAANCKACHNSHKED